jgi:ferritin-like protein
VDGARLAFPMSSENLHESPDELSDETKNMHRAIVSLMEELEAVDWYQQRAEACTDDDLKAVLTHNKNEEIEHAMMVLEWIRRHQPVFDDNMKTYLNSVGPITEVEAQAEADTANDTPAGAPSTSLGIGSLRGAK